MFSRSLTRIPTVVLATVLTVALDGFAVPAASTAGTRRPLFPLRVHEGGRFLVQADGRPFFYLGDTAWELFHRLNLEEARRYLDDRAAKGFTVIQAVALAELAGLTTPNANGHVPLVELDPTRPAVAPGDADDYWDHVDAILAEAEQRGLTVALLPSWGDKWNRKWGVGPVVFTPENAEVFGEWMGRRYGQRAIIWVVGGDRDIESDTHRAIIEAMVRGIRRGDGGARLITFHPQGGRGSSDFFPDAPWIDFHLRQNGHVINFDHYAGTARDYARTPVKPVIDGEPLYEDHPIHFNAKENGHSVAADIRRALYWDLFLGAFGHTYGHHSVWQMWAPGRPPVNGPLLPWYEAIDQPGAGQMQHGRHLIESRPFLTRIPADDLIVSAETPTAVPGAGRYRFVATRDEAGTYAMVYAPVGRVFSVRTDALRGETLRAWWFNPRTGQSQRLGDLKKEAIMTFISPTPGEALDWVLVLDDAAQDYPPPGHRAAP